MTAALALDQHRLKAGDDVSAHAVPLEALSRVRQLWPWRRVLLGHALREIFMTLVGLLILLIVGGVVFYLCWLLINMLPIAQPFKTAALCVLILIAILVLLDHTGLLGTDVLRLR